MFTKVMRAYIGSGAVKDTTLQEMAEVITTRTLGGSSAWFVRGSWVNTDTDMVESEWTLVVEAYVNEDDLNGPTQWMDQINDLGKDYEQHSILFSSHDVMAFNRRVL